MDPFDKVDITDNSTLRTGVVSEEVARANSNQVDVDVKDSALAQLG